LHKDKYDRQALKGLDTHDKDWIDYGHGQITYKDRLYIPADSQLRTDIIREHHDTIAAGHPGRWKTQENITRDYCGHACKDKSRSTSLDATCANAPSSQRKTS